MKKKLSAFCFLFTIATLTCVFYVLPDSKLTQLIFMGTLSFIFGLYTSVYASKKKCKKIGKLQSLFNGGLTSLATVSILALLISSLTSDILNKPMEMLITNKKMARYIGSLVYIFLVLRWLTQRNYNKSIEKVCKLGYSDMTDNLKKYNIYLDKKPESTDSDIQVKD